MDTTPELIFMQQKRLRAPQKLNAAMNHRLEELRLRNRRTTNAEVAIIRLAEFMRVCHETVRHCRVCYSNVLRHGEAAADKTPVRSERIGTGK
jgi:hypothetical protein